MYRGTLRDGTVFDQSQQPAPMPVAGVVKGFSEGLKLMTRGSAYRFWIKPELGYGDKSPDPSKIPNGSLLVFDVQLLGQLSNEQFQQLQMQQMMQGQGGAGGPQGGPAGPPPGAGAPPQG
jgi:FKBP-type peptidyl-prolyl cis-trans isomerase FkpA